MKGAEMMLKAMGLDPAELQQKFGEAVSAVQAKTVHIENQLTRIEIAQLHILHNMRVLADALKIEGMEYGEGKENPNFRLDFNGSDFRDDGPRDNGHINGNGG